MSRSATDDAEASQPQLFDQANVSGNSQHEPMPTAYARSLVKIYSRCNHTKDRPQRLEIALERLQEEHPDLPSTFDLTTWKDEGMGYTALHWAVYYSRHQMVKVLVDGGCNVNTRDWGRETPLFIACAKGDLLMVQKLVGLGAWVSVRSKHHESPLIVAAREGSPKVIQYLLRNGALAQPAWSVYWHAGMAGNVKAIETLLTTVPLENGFGPKDGSTVLQALCHDGQMEVVHVLLSGGLRWATDEEGRDIMMHGASCGHLGVVLALQEAGFELDDEKRVLALNKAIRCNNLSMFDALSSGGGATSREQGYWILESGDLHGKTLLHLACRYASTRLVASMVEHYGWKRNAHDNQDQSPLVYAFRGNCFDPMTLAYLVKIARVNTKCLSEKHRSALMKRVSAAMATPEWKDFLDWRHEYLAEKNRVKFSQRKAEVEEATKTTSLEDSSTPLCPLSKVPMTEAMLAADGFVYQRKAIREWIEDALSSK